MQSVSEQKKAEGSNREHLRLDRGKISKQPTLTLFKSWQANLRREADPAISRSRTGTRSEDKLLGIKSKWLRGATVETKKVQIKERARKHNQGISERWLPLLNHYMARAKEGIL